MSNEEVREQSMSEMMDEIDKSMKKIRTGDIVKGSVISVTDAEVMVNIGYRADGIISKDELSYDEDVNLREVLNPGDEIEASVLSMDDGDGNVLLSQKKADQVVVWDDLEEKYNEGTVFSVKVKEVVKGGVVANVRGVRGFIPASQLSVVYVEDLNQFVGQELQVKVLEFDKEKRNVVLSRKEVEKVELEEKKQQLWKQMKKGERRKGTVSRLTNFGAFVDLGGIDGLIHVSDLSWKRVKHPSEIVKVGDEVDVYVIDFDPKKERISLGLKDVNEDPWNKVTSKFHVNDIVEGKVVKLLDFGAFVEITAGIEGLVHISQISEKHIAKPSEVLTVGDQVKVKILEINEEDKRISLSIKEATNEFSEEIEQYSAPKEDDFTIGDVLKDKLKGLKF